MNYQIPSPLEGEVRWGVPFDVKMKPPIQLPPQGGKSLYAALHRPLTWILTMFLFVLNPSPMVLAPCVAADLAIRQNHLLFELAHEDGKLICAVQEIVVVESSGNSAGPVLLSVPLNAERVSPMPVPNIMPGMVPDPILREDEIEISPGQILVKRPVKFGKNTFSYGYILPTRNDAFRLEKKVLLPTRLMAAFAPKVDRLTSQSLNVESAADGYKILGHNLAVGTTIDLSFEGVHAGLSTGEERRDGSEMQAGMPAGAIAAGASGPSFSRFVIPSSAGMLLAVVFILYLTQMKKARTAVETLRQHLMDEIESLDAAAEKKEISAEFHKRQKKSVMDRLRSLNVS